MKAYTDTEQSKMLAEIFPLESADMSWVSNGLGKPFARTIPIKGDPEELCACWSLAALLDIIPMVCLDNFGDDTTKSMVWNCVSFPENYHSIETNYYDNPTDACVDMIVRLKKHKLI